MDDDSAVMSLAETAEHLGFLKASVRDAVERGYLQPARVVDGTPFFSVATVARYGRLLGLWSTMPAPAMPMQV